MKAAICSLLLMTLAAAAHVQAATKSPSTDIVIVPRSALPPSAQRPTEGMFLHAISSGQAFLYLEQEQGKALAILDVSDPGHIRDVGRVSLAVASPYDVVQSLSDSAVLVRFRDNSGFAVITLKKYKHPVITAAPELLSFATTQAFGQHALLLDSAANPVVLSREREAEVVDISHPSSPAVLLTVRGLTQQLERSDTGTLFLLGDGGLTVVRRPRMEEAYAESSSWVN